jgi:5-methyltetrahydropteroyltriglutamate--homocysteine methyltransferase
VVWEQASIPDDAVLIPGVISHSTILVEHPELIAQRIARYARIVGRERVIAGSDCGFATFAGSDEVHESIVWAKFDALGKGARLASQALWAKGPRKRPAKAVAKRARTPAAKSLKPRRAHSRPARKAAKRR